MKTNHTYQHFDACSQLSEYVHSFWMHANPNNEKESFIFAPDGFPKIILVYQNNQIKRYFKTGIFTEPKKVYVPANSITIGCRFKILAPEYLFNQSIAHLITQEESLDIDFLNAKHFDISNLDLLKEQWEKELLKIMPNKKPHNNKLRLSMLLYDTTQVLTVKQVSEQILWEQRQINRYLMKYLGISLKTYMNIRRAYNAYFDIKQGKLALTQDGFYDQSHFIKEIKKHTGASPKKVFQNQDEVFKQIRNITKK